MIYRVSQSIGLLHVNRSTRNWQFFKDTPRQTGRIGTYAFTYVHTCTLHYIPLIKFSSQSSWSITSAPGHNSDSMINSGERLVLPMTAAKIIMLSSIHWRRCTCGSLRGTKRERDKNIQFIRSFHNSCVDASATGEFNFHLTWRCIQLGSGNSLAAWLVSRSLSEFLADFTERTAIERSIIIGHD